MLTNFIIIGLTDTNMPWIDSIIKSSSRLSSTKAEELALIKVLIDRIYSFPADDPNRRLYLAASFDLLVAAEYYRATGHLGWVYCPSGDPMIYYPYTSICPCCVLKNGFHFHQANKPSSGNIGSATSRLLATFLEQLFKKNNIRVEILKGSEPVDAVFIDKTGPLPIYLFAEVKSAPLVTLPLVMKSEKLTQEGQGKSVLVVDHHSVNSNIHSEDSYLFIPKRNSNNSWSGVKYPLGKKENNSDTGWAYKGILNLVSTNKSFISDYFAFWISAFVAYSQLDKQNPIFWFTNACGQPYPKPPKWPKRSRGDGYESISDSKTSVGMDRTDDIKKSIYQVLKLGSEGKQTNNSKFLVGIVSNIHAVRHFEEYLKSVKDIVWTKDESGRAKIVADLPENTKLYNLFDGIISLTETLARDEWIRKTFSF